MKIVGPDCLAVGTDRARVTVWLLLVLVSASPLPGGRAGELLQRLAIRSPMHTPPPPVLLRAFELEYSGFGPLQSIMRLHILSDLHLEFAPFELPKVQADVVVLAGDVHPGFLGLKWIQENFQAVPVIYVLGNHEFYGKDIPKLTLELKERARGTNIHVLENNSVVIKGTTFLGATLWSDFELDGDLMAGQAEASFQMTDYRRIRLAPQYSRFRPRDSRRMHLESVAWIKQQIAANANSPTVIVTHHAPSRRSINPQKQRHPLNSSYASNLEALVESSRAQLWIHGHIHHCSDYMIGATRVLTNPRGYPEEHVKEFNPSLVVEV